MRFEFKPSFDRSIKALPQRDKEELIATCLSFLDLLETQTSLPSGIGLKRLRDDYWEVRQGLRSRILFRWSQDLIEFILAGNHDSIREFLKNI